MVNIRSVQAFPALQRSKLEQYALMLQKALPLKYRKGLLRGLSAGFVWFTFLSVMYSIGYYFGGGMIHDGYIDIGDMFL